MPNRDDREVKQVQIEKKGGSKAKKDIRSLHLEASRHELAVSVIVVLSGYMAFKSHGRSSSLPNDLYFSFADYRRLNLDFFALDAAPAHYEFCNRGQVRLMEDIEM